jgi:hypothetical protein
MRPRNGGLNIYHLRNQKRKKPVLQAALQPVIERPPYVEPVPFPRTMRKHILAQQLVDKKKAEEEAQKEKEEAERIRQENIAREEKEITKEDVKAMFAHCNVVELDTETSTYVQGKVKAKSVGKTILPCTFGGTSYYGLCDLGTAVNVIPYEFYLDIQDELESAELENTDMTIMLADKTLRIPMGVIKDASIYVGSHAFPIDFVVVDMPIDDDCPIIFGRTFLSTAGATIDYKKETITLKFGEERMKFHFSKFQSKSKHKEINELEEKEEKIIEDLAVVYYNTPADGLERSLVDNTDVPEDKEKKKLDDILNSTPILESPMNETCEEPERKGDEGFPPPELNPLPKELKYKFLDDTNKYPVIISADLSEREENRLMLVLRERRGAFGYSMDDLKGISPSIATHRIFMEE